MKIAVLISTYNWPEALDKVLHSLTLQTVMPDEVLIADDGSGEPTKQVIDKYKTVLPTDVKHIWHEDTGFRRSKILNKAIAKSTSDYIVQLDGDSFMHPKFIEDHKSNAKKGIYLFGTRVHIKEELVPAVLSSDKLRFNFFSKGLKKRPRSIYLPFISKFYGESEEYSKKLRGCNLSFWREDFIKVNGYNEDMEGWGREDSELVLRFHNMGLKARRLKFTALVYHLDHRISDKSMFEANNNIQKITKEQKLVWVANGIKKYLND